MKRILLTLVTIVTISLSSFGQAPDGFKYQAVVRDASNNTLNSQAVGMRMTIQQGSIGGTAVYQETFAPTTNAYGLVNLEIGNGTVVFGDFSTIDWAAGPYFIETAVDITGGTTFAVMGTSQLMSVPYALHAKTAESVTNDMVDDADADPTNEMNTNVELNGTDLEITDGNGTLTADLSSLQGGGGATGQSVNETYGSSQITPPISTTFTLIPGLTQTITVPTDCYVVVTTDGGVQCASAGANYAVVDIAIHADGVASTVGGQRRVVAANTSSLGQVVTNWSMTKTYSLSAGTHTFDVRVKDDGSGSSNANVSSGSDPRLRGTLQVMIIKF